MTPIVLIPGLLCSAEVFAPQIPALWPYGPVTVASTLQGRSIAEMADAVLAEAPPRFALAGLSMGGYVGFEILRRAPERVSRLALISTSARADRPEQVRLRRAWIDRVRRGQFDAFVDDAMAAILHPSRRDDPALGALNRRMAEAVGVEAFLRQTEAVGGRIDSRPHLAAISVPTLVLVGDSDPLTPPRLSQEMAAAIPNARLEILAACGHASTLEQPAAVNRALADWIAG
jgi:pimeloyl-ACP methyl ester carboxylesterase